MFPILVGVNIITFFLFFVINTPDDMARIHLGQKYVSNEAIAQYKQQMGYDLPVFYNEQAEGLKRITKTIFFNKSLQLFKFEFGLSDQGRDIMQDVQTRMWPSLAIAVPSFIFGLILNIIIALMMALVRGSLLDKGMLIFCVILMSISSLFYIIAFQFFFSKILKWFPISGYTEGFAAWHFLLLPIITSIIAGLGSGVRWYRILFLEEMSKDYIQTARAKGLTAVEILFKHVLRNALIPILTGVVVVIPLLFMGSLLLESFFGIPGLGSYTIDAIQQQDFAVIRVMVFLGTLLYIAGLLLTDLSYLLVDPRVQLTEH